MSAPEIEKILNASGKFEGHDTKKISISIQKGAQTWEAISVPLKVEKTEAEVTNDGELKAGYLPLFMFIAKFVAPVVIAIVFLHGLGLF